MSISMANVQETFAIQNDLLMAIDREKAAVLVLIGISAAFYTIDQKIILQCRDNKNGVCGVALDWFRSYI